MMHPDIQLARYARFGVLAASLLVGTLPVHAQKGDDKNKSKEAAAAPAKDDTKSIEEVTKKCRKLPGLFALYQDSTNGSVYMQISKNHLDREYIYFAMTTDGPSDAGHFRGAYRDTKVFKVGKHYGRIEFTVQNTNFYFDSTNAISKAANANISNAILFSGAIVAQNKEKSEFLIKADDLFLSESFHQIKPVPNPMAPPGAQYNLGMLSKDKTKYAALRNYPANTDVVVTYVYDNPSPMNGGGEDITDPHSTMLSMQHTIVEMPKNDFKPRRDDSRVGYFIEKQNDMTSKSATPYHDFIHRWHLVKKDPNAKVSDVVEPITWWIEKTTPVELRPIIKKAGETWNLAFEAAGYRNAVVVKEQADTATWDAGDIRYNVLRWTSSPNPPFGGYGPSFVNPRTGQILGADIMLEWVFLTNKVVQAQIFETAGLPNHQFSHARPSHTGQHACEAGLHLQSTMSAGITALEAMGAAAVDQKRFYEEGVYYLILHEMGHTLGLMHNMKSSQLHGVPQVYDRSITETIGLTGSVMEYPASNIPPDNSKPCQYFTTKPGPYDFWAINYGYSQALPNAAQEEARLTAILNRSTEPALAFGNDADDMRAPGKAIDPRVNIGDMSADAITYATNRLALNDKVMPTLKARYVKAGGSYQELRDRYLRLSGERAIHSGVISRYVGGVYVDRAFVGQSGATKPYTPVALADQKRAMAALNTYLFAPDAFKLEADLYNYLAMQRRGYDFFEANEDPRITARALNQQRDVLAQLLHPNTVQRINDSELYGNKYKLTDMMNDLTASIFKADLAGVVNPFRQNLQTEYVNNLIGGVGSKEKRSPYNYAGQNAALAQLLGIKTMLSTAPPAVDASTKAHRTALLFRINQALKQN